MEEERRRQICMGYGKGKTGRPKLRRLDCTENDLISIGVKRWRKNADDRSAWAVIPKEALVKL
jgi:hypothetical protein